MNNVWNWLICCPLGLFVWIGLARFYMGLAVAAGIADEALGYKDEEAR